MKVYISGPMTGYPDHNALAFSNAAYHLDRLGHESVNPGDVMPYGPDLTWADYLRGDLRALMDCQAVATLSGWRESRGACLEVYVAQQLGMTVLPINQWARSATPGEAS